MLNLYHLSEVYKSRKQGLGYNLYIPELNIRQGEKIAITGPSGCGKSTALDILGMVLKPCLGNIFTFQPNEKKLDVLSVWKNKNPSAAQDELALWRLSFLSYILQTGGLLSFLTVYENIILSAKFSASGLWRREAKRTTEEHFSAPKNIKATALELAERFNISHLLQTMPSKLSIGERQRVSIARALLLRPAVILADEPTAALDPVHAETVLNTLLQTVDDFGVTLILVTHDQTIVDKANLREIRIKTEKKENNEVVATLTTT